MAFKMPISRLSPALKPEAFSQARMMKARAETEKMTTIIQLHMGLPEPLRRKDEKAAGEVFKRQGVILERRMQIRLRKVTGIAGLGKKTEIGRPQLFHRSAQSRQPLLVQPGLDQGMKADQEEYQRTDRQKNKKKEGGRKRSIQCFQDLGGDLLKSKQSFPFMIFKKFPGLGFLSKRDQLLAHGAENIAADDVIGPRSLDTFQGIVVRHIKDDQLPLGFSRLIMGDLEIEFHQVLCSVKIDP
jgi:hypothetical protein